ncbi:tetratricopeptide repeat protein [Longispora urticae]
MTICDRPGCGGTVEDGYCDVAGHAYGTAPASAPVSTPTAPATLGLSSARGSRKPGSGRTSGRTVGRGRLGAGLIDIPPVPYRDPASAVLDTAEVPERKRYCSRCSEPVGRAAGGRPGRTEGFCKNCGHAYSFTPKLRRGELLGGQYEVLGPIAHGGLGWIYLARDRNVSDAWRVLKGLLDSGDADAMAAAVAERRFLAEVDHPNIVKIYNFVQHTDAKSGENVGYTVMEYVGGRSLRDILLDERAAGGHQGPLPAERAIAYMLEILPALGYLHQRGLLFCDFKPDNVIQTEEQLKLIDLGGVRQIDDLDSAIYGTVGYQAPEIADEGPSVSSDLYTVGRTLAVLSLNFQGYATSRSDSLPPVSATPELADAESFHRFLRRATHLTPDLRFATAADMAEQLTGVLRELLASRDGQPRPAVSTLFGPEQRVAPADPDPAEAAACLPVPLVDGTDPAAGFLASITVTDPAELLALLAAAPRTTLEVTLRRVRALLATGDVPAATAELDGVPADEALDWRVGWYRGIAALTAGDTAGAATLFDAVYDALPGEAAPKLALATTAECAGDLPTADRYYELVWRTDRSYVGAAFGLARVRVAAGRHVAAREALDAVPHTSSHHLAAQLTAISAHVSSRPAAELSAAELLSAGARLEALTVDAERRGRIAVDLLTAALAWHSEGRPGGDAPPRARLLGTGLTETELRTGLEGAYRTLARLATDPGTRVALVDQANGVRPRTWV